jgi:sugar phosphate isomerase/epimerase
MLVVSTLFGFPRTKSLVAAVTEIGSMEFAGVELAAESAVPDAFDAAALCREKRLKCRTIAAPIGEPAGDLSSPDGAIRQRAVASVLAVVPLAAEVQAQAIVIRMGEAGPEREAHLDAAARSLYDLTRAVPEVAFSIRTPAKPGGFPDPDELGLLFEDAAGHNVAYTHDVAAGDSAEWLARHGPRTFSVVLHDRMGEMTGLPPGGGEVDWTAVRSGVSTGMLKVLSVGANFSGAELLAGVARLKDLGIAS